MKYKKNESNIFGNDNGEVDSGNAKKKTNYQAAAAVNNGNILLWDKWGFGVENKYWYCKKMNKKIHFLSIFCQHD